MGKYTDLMNRIDPEVAATPAQPVAATPTLAGEFGKGLAQGTMGVAEMVGGVTKFAGDVTGINPLSSLGTDALDYWKKQSEGFAPAVSSYTEVKPTEAGGARRLAEYAAQGLGSLVPTMAAAAGAATLGAAAAPAVGLSALGGATAGAAVGSYGMELGSIYGDQEKGKESPATAALWAIPAAAMDVLPESRLLSKFVKPGKATEVLLKKMVAPLEKIPFLGSSEGKAWYSRGLREALVQGGSEGATEFAQTLMEQKGSLQKTNWEDAINAGFIGAMGGGVLGGGAAMLPESKAKAPLVKSDQEATILDALAEKIRNPEVDLGKELDQWGVGHAVAGPGASGLFSGLPDAAQQTAMGREGAMREAILNSAAPEGMRDNALAGFPDQAGIGARSILAGLPDAARMTEEARPATARMLDLIPGYNPEAPFPVDHAAILADQQRVAAEQRAAFDTANPVVPEAPVVSNPYQGVLDHLSANQAFEVGKTGTGFATSSDFTRTLQEAYPSLVGVPKGDIISALNAKIEGNLAETPKARKGKKGAAPAEISEKQQATRDKQREIIAKLDQDIQQHEARNAIESTLALQPPEAAPPANDRTSFDFGPGFDEAAPTAAASASAAAKASPAAPAMADAEAALPEIQPMTMADAAWETKVQRRAMAKAAATIADPVQVQALAAEQGVAPEAVVAQLQTEHETAKAAQTPRPPETLKDLIAASREGRTNTLPANQGIAPAPITEAPTKAETHSPETVAADKELQAVGIVGMPRRVILQSFQNGETMLKQNAAARNNTEGLINHPEFTGFPVLPEGGLESIKQTEKYQTDAQYRDKVDAFAQGLDREAYAVHAQQKMLLDAMAVMQLKAGELANVGSDTGVVSKFSVDLAQIWNTAANKTYNTSELGNMAVRETLQNALDAVITAMRRGETKRGTIDMTVVRDYSGTSSITIEDNGIGMDAEGIAGRFLTLGDKSKNALNEGGFGGFGMGKAVVLGFTPNNSWSLHSRGFYTDSKITTAQGNIQNMTPRKGTKLVSEATGTEGYYAFDSYAPLYAQFTEVPKGITLTYNGEVAKVPKLGKVVGTQTFVPNEGKTSIAVTLYKKALETKEGANLEGRTIIRQVDPVSGAKLVMGIVRAGMPGMAIIDITTSLTPTDSGYPLTTDRSALKWEPAQEINEFLKSFTVKEVIEQMEKATEATDNTQTKDRPIAEVSKWKVALARAQKDPVVQSMLSAVNEWYVADGGEGLLVDPNAWMVKEEKNGKLPAATVNMLKTAVLYEAMIRMSARVAGLGVTNFSILDYSAENNIVAHYSKAGNTGFNTRSFDYTLIKSPTRMYHYMMALTNHELTHAFHDKHDTNFAATEVALAAQTTTKETREVMDKLTDLIAGVKPEVVPEVVLAEQPMTVQVEMATAEPTIIQQFIKEDKQYELFRAEQSLQFFSPFEDESQLNLFGEEGARSDGSVAGDAHNADPATGVGSELATGQEDLASDAGSVRPSEEVAPVYTRSKTFKEDGTYRVTMADGTTYSIYRDPHEGTGWYLEGSGHYSDLSLAAWNRADALKSLQEMHNSGHPRTERAYKYDGPTGKKLGVPKVSKADVISAKQQVVKELSTVKEGSARADQLEIQLGQYNDIIAGDASYSDFQPAQYSVNDKFVLNPETLTSEAVQGAFPGQQVTEAPDGFVVALKNGAEIKIAKVGEIFFRVASAEAALGRALKAGERPVAAWQKFDIGGIISLTEQGVGELSHEVFHGAFSLALTRGEQAAVLKKYGTEEKAAVAYQAWLGAKTPETFFQKIKAFFTSLKESFAPTAEGVFSKVAEGTVWGNIGDGSGGQKFSFGTALTGMGKSIMHPVESISQSSLVDKLAAYFMPANRLIDQYKQKAQLQIIRPLIDALAVNQQKQRAEQDDLQSYAGLRFNKAMDSVAKEKGLGTDPAKRKQLTGIMAKSTLWQLTPGAVVADPKIWTDALWKLSGNEDKTGLSLKGAQAQINADWRAMTPAMQTAYTDLLESNVRALDQMKKENINFLKRTVKDPVLAAKMIAQVDKRFSKVQGPYFTLARFGQFEVKIKEADVVDANGDIERRGKTLYSAQFESQSDAEQFAADANKNARQILKNAGLANVDQIADLVVTPGYRAPISRTTSNIPESFINQMKAVLDKTGMVDLRKELRTLKRMVTKDVIAGVSTIPDAVVEKIGELSKAATMPEVTRLKGELKAMMQNNAEEQALLGEVMGAIDDAGLSAEVANRMKNDFDQLWLAALPETSVMKNFIKRKGVLGYEDDMLRGYLSYHQKHARSMAFIKYGSQINTNLNDMQKTSSKITNAPDQFAVGQFIEMMRAHQTHMMTEKVNPVVGMLTKIPFMWYLTSPSVLLVQSSQPYTITVPFLGARFSFGKAMSAVTSSYGRQMKGEFADPIVLAFNQKHQALIDSLRDLDDAGNTAEVNKLTQHLTLKEKELLAIAMTPTLSISLTHEVTQFIKEGKESNTKFLDKAGYFMSVSETASRKAGFLAAFDLKFQDTGDFSASVKLATEAVNSTLYDYSAANRPKILTGNFGRLFGQFRVYQLQTTFHVLKLAMDSTYINTLSPEARKVARKELLTLMGMNFALAGAAGVPGIASVTLIMGVLNALLGDDDEPYDADMELAKALGKLPGGSVIAKGLPALLGMDISKRIGAGGITSVFQSSPPEGKHGADLAGWYAANAAGPAFSTFVTMPAQAFDAYRRGDWLDAFKASMPKPLKDLARAYQMNEEGVKTGGGQLLIKPEDVNVYQIALAAVGINPLEMSLKSEEGRMEMSYTTQISERRALIVKEFVAGVNSKSQGDMDAAVEKVKAYNEKQPMFALSGSDLMNGFNTSYKKSLGLLSKKQMAMKRELGEE